MGGYDDGTMRPTTEISRQEAAVILFKLLKLESIRDEKWVDGFNDSHEIADWSREYVNAAVAGGYLSGYPDGTFNPARIITRAETVALLGKAVGLLFNQPGTYGPEEGRETVSGNVTVNVSDVTLQNLVIEGDLFLTAGIGDGDFEADGIVVKGRTIICGGGKDSVVFNNSSLEEVIVYIVDGKVRVVARGDTYIGNVVLESGAHLQEESLTGDGFGNVQILVLKPGESIELEGDFDRINIEAAVDLNVTGDTRIGELEVSGEAKGTNIDIDKDTVIKNLTLNGAAEVTGQGTIKTANVNTDDYSFEKEPEKKVVDGEEVKEEKKTSGGGSSGPTRRASTYKFHFEIPGEIVEGEEAEIGVTFATNVKRDSGYEGVRFKFSKTDGPGDAIFAATDSKGNPYLATNEGYWGPGSGFDIPAEYTATTPWKVTFNEAGTYTFVISLVDADTDNVVAGITTTVTVEVLKSIERSNDDIKQDPGYTGGTELEYSFEGTTKTLTIDANNGILPYYLQQGAIPPRGANWIGIEIPVPEGVDTATVTSTINGKPTENLQFFEENRHFEYISVKAADLDKDVDSVTYKSTYIWAINWGSGYASETIIVNLVNIGGLEDIIAPVLEGVSPERGNVFLAHDETFVFTVDAYDEGILYELEIDHSMEDTLPEFSVYADEDNPYGTDDDKKSFENYGVTVTYDVREQKWTIDFGETVTAAFAKNGGITFYIVIKDLAGNQFGTMYGTTPENTFAYTITQEPSPPEADFEFTAPQDLFEGTDEKKGFSIKVSNVANISNDVPIRYLMKVTDDSDSLDDKIIGYGTGSDTFTIRDGQAYFGPAAGFTLQQLPSLETSNGVTTPFKVIDGLDAGTYKFTVSIVQVNGDTLVNSEVFEFTVKEATGDVELNADPTE
jgi:hypothetical protein